MNAQVNELISKLNKQNIAYEIIAEMLYIGEHIISCVSGRTRSGISIYELNDYLFGS